MSIRSAKGPVLRSVRAVARGARRSRPLRALLELVRSFLRDECLLRASALAASTLVALVPLLAIVLAVLKGAGFERTLRPLLLDRFPVLSAAAVDQLIAYIGRANAQAMGGIGFAALLVSASALFATIEASLNAVFGAPRGRSTLLRLGDYLGMLVFGTIVLVLGLSLQTALRTPVLLETVLGHALTSDATRALLSVGHWLALWGGFTVLYTWMPNTSVPWRAALAGGFVAAVLFGIVEGTYFSLQIGFSRYHAVYGALAQLPILVLWVYVSWAVTLFGAEVTARAIVGRARWAAHEDRSNALAWTVLREVLLAFDEGRPTPSPKDIANRLGCSVGELQRSVEPLLRARVIVGPGHGHGYLPARAPAAISLEEIARTLRAGRSPAGPAAPKPPGDRATGG